MIYKNKYTRLTPSNRDIRIVNRKNRVKKSCLKGEFTFVCEIRSRTDGECANGYSILSTFFSF